MSHQTAFQRGVVPMMDILLPGREDAVLSFKPDAALVERIDLLASRCTEGELTPEEREEYEGYVRADMFIAILRKQAERMSHAR